MKRFIRDLKEKDHVQSVFLVSEKNAGSDRNGKMFLSLTLMDATGQINARMFEKAEDAGPQFEAGDPIWVKGFVQLFQNRRQLVVNELRRASEDEVNMTELVADLVGDPREHLNALTQIVQELENATIRELLLKTLEDTDVSTLLLKAPAAKSIHHAYRGGLIEHIHSIARTLLSVANDYPFLDRSLLVFGAIYHDLGKIYELDMTDGIHYTQSGRLVGHMAQACEMIDRFSSEISEFPVDLRDVLKHIVLSHHGKLEYGSPKLPMLPEAIAISMIDDFDSKMNTVFHFLKMEAENVPANQKWSHYHPGFQRYFYLDFFRKKQNGESIS